MLDIKDASRALDRLATDEKGTTFIRTPGGEQEVLIVNEPGLYRLIMRSNKQEAREFQRWIAHEVLPQIRAMGRKGVIVRDPFLKLIAP